MMGGLWWDHPIVQGWIRDGSVIPPKYLDGGRVCALCDGTIGLEAASAASDGLIIHDRCEEEYEDLVYHREFHD